MASSVTTGRGTPTDRGTDGTFSSGTERRSTETKAAFKTTEFFAYLAVLAGILIAGLLVDNAGGDGGFGAQDVWLYSTILTVGYMISRGLAKAGSSDPYTHDRDGR